ncbi:EAL domain-containing protein [Ciceribacter sp. L1K22]|uniref:putative bifunctional diguanylate cyclase/phosphodiesterase n=1 Tax=Ciceribacter sp. L1K22 TaxID=2820275 RepID=UPI001ABDA129|nr:EAL domain-containing protein [Ciceribacter sp. L1K22]MBO3762027.1 EAL domain-containing protein [Ciceribacter sp. L1K22]
MKVRNTIETPKEVQLSLVSSLFDNSSTLLKGMVVHILAYAVVFHKTGDPIYLLVSLAFMVVFASRILLFRRFARADKSTLTVADIRRWEIRYVIGAASTAAVLGIGCGYSILVYEDTFVELASVAVAMASMVSIVGRNYGSRLAVNLQTFACCAPIIVGAFLANDPYKAVLSAMLIPFMLTTEAMAKSLREFLHENVVASRDMKTIADRFDTALNNMTHGLIMLDTENRIQVINRKACELLHLGERNRLKGYDLDVALRYGVRHTVVGGSLPGMIQRQLTQLMDGSLSRAVMTFSDDLVLEFSASRRPEGGVVLIFEDVTARASAERKILHMVRYDSLTGLPQRNHFAELVAERVSEQEDIAAAALLLLDVDGFRHVNDTKGYTAGDRLLVAIGQRLQQLAHGEVVGHLVGDQFIVFGTNRDGLDSLIERLRRIHADLCGTYELDGMSFRVSFSAGCMAVDPAVASMEEWQIKLDLALFESKSRGGGRLTFFAEEMDARYVERQRLQDDLRDAIENGALSVAYQPMFLPDGSRIACCEALARWIHPTKGSIPPNIFIPLAEDMGIAAHVTHLIVDTACHAAAAWPENVAVSVNLSVQDLRTDTILQVVRDALSRSGLSASRLHLEITETSLIEELATARSILEALRAMGITIAIDDFGTGFSSLSYLDSLPADVVKIDRSFVRNITGDSRRLKLLEGIVNLSRQLDLKIVIEGVESKEQLALINQHRCADLIQGYVYSTPQSAEDISNLLERTRKKGRGGRAYVA